MNKLFLVLLVVAGCGADATGPAVDPASSSTEPAAASAASEAADQCTTRADRAAPPDVAPADPAARRGGSAKTDLPALAPPPWTPPPVAAGVIAQQARYLARDAAAQLPEGARAELKEQLLGSM